MTSRLIHGFRLVTARQPRPAEMTILTASLERTLLDFQADRAGAEALLNVGAVATQPGLDTAELAAYTTVASTLLNLDETVTRE